MLEFAFWYSCKDFVDNEVEQDVSFDAQDFHVFRDDFFEKFKKKSILFWNHQLYK
jgi:hypothetical protein